MANHGPAFPRRLWNCARVVTLSWRGHCVYTRSMLSAQEERVYAVLQGVSSHVRKIAAQTIRFGFVAMLGDDSRSEH